MENKKGLKACAVCTSDAPTFQMDAFRNF